MSRTVIECPRCSQSLRVPSDRGSILVTCGACSLEWRWTPDERFEEAEEDDETDRSDSKGGDSGILSWFSKTTQKLTGSSADVFLTPTAESVRPGEALEVEIGVHVSDFDLEVKSVNVELLGEEIVALPWQKVRRKLGAEFDAVRETTNILIQGGKFVHRESIFDRTYRASDKESWKPNSQVHLDVKVPIPSNAIPTFEGQTIGARWSARAVVETSGVSPKSEWIMINVSDD